MEKNENLTVTMQRKIIKKTQIFLTKILFLPINLKKNIREKKSEKKTRLQSKKKIYEKISRIFFEN